jgi:uncharacterized protein (DUF1697 family)
MSPTVSAEQAIAVGRAKRYGRMKETADIRIALLRRHAYITYPAGIGRSRLTAAVIEKAFGVRGTGRNWNTVLKLAALAEF